MGKSLSINFRNQAGPIPGHCTRGKAPCTFHVRKLWHFSLHNSASTDSVKECNYKSFILKFLLLWDDLDEQVKIHPSPSWDCTISPNQHQSILQRKKVKKQTTTFLQSTSPSHQSMTTHPFHGYTPPKLAIQSPPSTFYCFQTANQ